MRNFNLNLVQTIQEWPNYSCKVVYTEETKAEIIDKVYDAVTELFAFFLTPEAHAPDMANKLRDQGIMFDPLPFNPATENEMKKFRATMMYAMNFEIEQCKYSKDFSLTTDYHPEGILARVLRIINYKSAQTCPGNPIFPYKTNVWVQIKPEYLELSLHFNHEDYFSRHYKNDGVINALSS